MRIQDQERDALISEYMNKVSADDLKQTELKYLREHVDHLRKQLHKSNDAIEQLLKQRDAAIAARDKALEDRIPFAEAFSRSLRERYEALLRQRNEGTSIRIKRTAPEAILPTQAHDTDAGWDLYAPYALTLKHGATTKINLHIAVQMEPGWELQIRPRSGLSAQGLYIAFGTVDADYRGEIQVVARYEAMLVCTSSMPEPKRELEIVAGQRIAQAVIKRVYRVDWQEVQELDETKRGVGGFGSTDKKWSIKPAPLSEEEQKILAEIEANENSD